MSNAGLEALKKAPRGKPIKYRERVNAMCRWCIHDPLSGLGHWREQVEGCTATDCPLYDIRPRSQRRANRKKRQSED